MGVGWGGEGAEKVRSLTHLLRMGEKRWGADVGSPLDVVIYPDAWRKMANVSQTQQSPVYKRQRSSSTWGKLTFCIYPRAY